MDLNQFLKRRRARWDRLAALLERVNQFGMSSLSGPETDEFFALYRLVSSDLNLVQTRTGNPALVEYLEGLVGRAYAALATPKQVRPLHAWWRVVRHRFPAVLRAEKRLLAISAAAMLAGIVFGFVITWLVPESADAILPREHLVQSPSEHVVHMEKMEKEGRTPTDSTGRHLFFTSFLFTHNIRVTILAFALGFTLGIGTVIVLFFNGAMLGSLAARYFQDGVGTFFVAWVGPHGAIELPCILIGGMAGLMLARAQLRRDEGTLAAQLRLLRGSLVDLLVGTASLLVVAGVIEGGFSQVNEPAMPYALKIAVAAMLFLGLIGYLFFLPVRRTDGGNRRLEGIVA